MKLSGAGWSLLIVLAGAMGATLSASAADAGAAVENSSLRPRMVIFSSTGNEWRKDFLKGFQRGMIDITKACGVDGQVYELTKSNQESLAAQIDSFKPDTVLSVKFNGGVKNQYGAILMWYFDVQLTDARTGQVAWHSDIHFNGEADNIFQSIAYSQAERGALLAMKITNEMKSARLFGNCPVYGTIKEIPAAPASAGVARHVGGTPPAGATTLELPGGWTEVSVSDALKARHVVYRAAQKDSGAILLISERKREEVSDFQKYAENLLASQLDAVTDGKASDIENLDIGTMPARRFTVQGTGKKTGKDLTFLITVIDRKDRITTLTVESPTDQFSGHRDAFLQLGDFIR